MATPDQLPDNSVLAERLGITAIDLTVVDTARLSPTMQRIVLTGPQLRGMEHAAGQDLMLTIGGDGGGVVRRRYTMRYLAPTEATVTLAVLLHGDGPGASWAGAVRPGDRVGAVGPRGKVVLDPDGSWHLFVGDDSFVPAALSMAEAAPTDATLMLVLGVAGPADRQPHAIAAEATTLEWAYRHDAPPDDATALLDELAEIELPKGLGHAYVGAELGVMQAVSAALRERGLPEDAISAKPYWRSGVANAPHGEPARG